MFEFEINECNIVQFGKEPGKFNFTNSYVSLPSKIYKENAKSLILSLYRK